METNTQNIETTGHDVKITAANESRFSAAHYSEPLTAFTAGWKDNDELAKLLDFLAPTVEVGRRFEFKKANNAECFLSEDDDVRAIGAAFKRVEYSGESVNEKTLNKGLTIRVDHDDIVGDSWRERYVHMLLQRLYRNEVRRAVDALVALDTTSTAKIWAGATASNPEGDVLEAILAAGDAMGVEPNRALFGRGAWQLRHQLYANGQTASAFAGLGMNPMQLASTLGLDDVRVSKERYQQSGQTGKTRLMSDKVILFHARNVLDKDDPSNLKRFVTPTEGGLFRVYLDEQCKYTDITVEHYSNIVTTSTLGVKCLNVSAK
ncbi:MAG: hypothetical protein B7X06_00040 [Verrucomicrobia bacterium 21-51-4]|nr:MAG: hypothetical protein B7X06_00040 [Verrucomicrobia bacterium 21-51-4]